MCLCCLILCTDSLAVSAAFSPVGTGNFKIYFGNDKLLFSGNSVPSSTDYYLVDDYDGSVSVDDNGTFVYSSHINVPITLDFASSGLYNGRYVGRFKMSTVFKNVSSFYTNVRVRWGTPTVVNQYDDISLLFGSGMNSFSSITSDASLSNNEEASYYSTDFLAVYCNNLNVSIKSKGSSQRYVFYASVPFTLTVNNPEALRFFNLDFEWFEYRLEPLDVYENSLYLDKSVKSGSDQIVDSMNDNAEQAHADAEKALEQSKQAQSEAHADAEKASGERKNIFQAIASFFGSFFSNLLDAVKSLFIPSDDELSSFMEEMKSFLNERLGFLAYPFELFTKLLALVNEDSEAVLVLPGFSIMDHVVWEPHTFRLEYFLFTISNLGFLVTAVRTGTGVIIVGAFLMYCQKKFNEVLGGASE